MSRNVVLGFVLGKRDQKSRSIRLATRVRADSVRQVNAKIYKSGVLSEGIIRIQDKETPIYPYSISYQEMREYCLLIYPFRSNFTITSGSIRFGAQELLGLWGDEIRVAVAPMVTGGLEMLTLERASCQWPGGGGSALKYRGCAGIRPVRPL